MNFDRENDYYRDLNDVEDQCKKYLYFHVVLTMTDGRKADGIIQNVDANGITMLVGKDVMENESQNNSGEQRQYYDYDYDYDRPITRYRQFTPGLFPLNTLAKIALLPYITSYPYYPQYYPYY